MNSISSISINHGSGYFPPNAIPERDRKLPGAPHEDTVSISRQARQLERTYAGKKASLEKNFADESKALEREYLQNKRVLEAEFQRKKQSLGSIDMYV